MNIVNCCGLHRLDVSTRQQYRPELRHGVKVCHLFSFMTAYH